VTADVVFISFNRKKEVEYNLLKMSVYDNLNKIIWVDNGSADGVEEVRFDSKKVIFIPLKENVGIKAYNIGVNHSQADIIIILDDDSHIDEEAIIKTIDLFKKDPGLGVLAYQIILPSTGEIVTKDWQPGPSTYFWGCGAAVRKSVWDNLGGYNERLFLYGNEYDISIRIWNSGYKVIFTPDIVAFHRVSSMNRTSGRLVSYSIRNNFIYIKTYFGKRYHFKLFFYDRLAWFIRALFTGSVASFFKGLKMIKEIRGTIVQYPISKEVQQFYILNQRIFEDPVRKIKRKIKYGLFFKFSANV
jgi:GT2 family glycosyltransferase